jgi:hypothetical protein
MHRHVVRHEIQDQPEIGVGERLRHARKPLLAAEFRIELAMIDDVIAMRAASAGLEEWRGVKMADAKIAKIGREPRGVIEAEILGQLHAIGGERNVERHQRSPAIQ